MRTFFVIVLLVVLVAAGWFTWAALLPVARRRPRSSFFVPVGRRGTLRDELQHDGIIRSADAFLLLHYAAGHWAASRRVNTSLKRPPMRWRCGGACCTAMFTCVRSRCPEGYNIYDIAAVVEQAGLGPAADFVTAAKGDVFLIKDLDPNATSLEGYLFPDTYHFTRIDTPHDIVAAMVHRFRQEAEKIGLLRQG